MSTFTKLQAVCLATGLAVTASAAPIVQTKSVSTHTPDYSETLTFNQYSSVWALESIEVIITLAMFGGQMEFDNDSEQIAEVFGMFGVRGRLTSSDVSLNDGSGNPWLNVNNTVSASFELDPTTGDPINEFNNTGLGDYASFAGPSFGNAQVVSISAFIDPAYFDDFVGSGTFGILYTATQRTVTDLAGGVQSATTASQAFASVQVIYTPVPEPGSMALGGIGAMLLFWRRRRA